jgi:allantoicase
VEGSVNNLNAAAGTETDLASRWLGGSVLAASDESFGEKENLLNPAPAAFEPGRYGPRGEIVDGWETRRRREPGHDWAIIRLGAPGVITLAEIDTSFFTGNHPESCLVEAGGWEGYPGPAELAGAAAGWQTIVPRSPLTGDTRNHFPVSDPRRFTHLRLSAFPDGGVARLRAHGQVVPDPRELDGLTIDLASQRHGGAVVASSDDFYTSAALLIRPDTARSMGEGWETRRRRDGGHDFVVIRLAFAGQVSQLIVDTAHFRYNASAEVAVQACAAPGRAPAPDSADWMPLLGRTRLQPDTRHVLAVPALADGASVTSIRLDAFPDGGISRLRVIGRISPAARLEAGYRWFNSLPGSQAVRCLAGAGLPGDLASAVAGRRPLGAGWADELFRGPGTLGGAGGRAGRAAAGAMGAISALLAGPAAG